jgi:hypothetical protein
MAVMLFNELKSVKTKKNHNFISQTMLSFRRVDLYVKPVLSELLQMRQPVKCSDLKMGGGNRLFRERRSFDLVCVKPFRHDWQRHGRMQMTVVSNIVTPASFGQNDQARCLN